jgi:adenosylhomocysteine nucleosidase
MVTALAGCQAEKGEETGSQKDVIGIIGAMEEEVTTLKEEANVSEPEKIADMEFCKGELDGKDVVIVQCGMGKVNAGICAHTLINDFGCTKIINTGVAGSLDNKIDIGDIVISTEAVQHDFDVEPIGFKKGEVPYTGLVAFPADEELRKEAVEATKKEASGVRYFEGRVCSGDQFIATREQKKEIEDNFGGLCCEMEGAAVAQACYLNHTPFVIIRAISDKEDASQTIDYETFKEGAAKRCAGIVEYMVKTM